MRLRRLRAASMLAALLLATPSCDDEAITCPSEPPAISSFTIAPTTVAAGESIMATLVVENFELTHGGSDHHGHSLPTQHPQHDDEPAAASCPGGHIHVYLDDVMSNPLSQSIETTFPIAIPKSVEPGDHLLIARLNDREHFVLEQVVSAEATVTVTAP